MALAAKFRGCFELVRKSMRFQEREFEDDLYYNLKRAYQYLKISIIIADIVFINVEINNSCISSSSYATDLQVHKVLTSTLILMVLLNFFDILY